jgi:GT2 family glycosyltransferase
MTANMAYKKSVFKQIDGFYSGFDSPFREDSDLAFTAIEQGYDCDFLPEAIVKHPTSKKKLTHIMFETKVFRYDMLLFKRHPELYKKHITAPVEMFTVLYISSLLLTYWFRLSVCLVPLISAMEGRSRGREFSLVDSILYGFAKMVSSCVLVISVVIGAIQYKVNPMNLFRNT